MIVCGVVCGICSVVCGIICGVICGVGVVAIGVRICCIAIVNFHNNVIIT